MTWLERSQLAANIATSLGVASVWLAWHQFRASTLATRRASAVAAWGEYLRLALAHPTLARPQPWLTGQGVGSAEHDRYRWFMAATLFACEQVLDAHPQDRAWESVVTAQLRYHQGFLSSQFFDPKVYSPTLARLAKVVTASAPPSTPGGE